tara:strand:- start:840 stop:1136 length:297 start_codon:yes stop_codon:yes gene_type:complete
LYSQQVSREVKQRQGQEKTESIISFLNLLLNIKDQTRSGSEPPNETPMANENFETDTKSQNPKRENECFPKRRCTALHSPLLLFLRVRLFLIFIIIIP